MNDKTRRNCVRTAAVLLAIVLGNVTPGVTRAQSSGGAAPAAGGGTGPTQPLSPSVLSNQPRAPAAIPRAATGNSTAAVPPRPPAPVPPASMGAGHAPAPATTLVVAPGTAGFRDVRVPMHLTYEFIQRALAERLFADHGTVHVSVDQSGCSHLDLSDPGVTGEPGLVRVRMRAVAQVGTALGGRCMVLTTWHGYVDVFERPSVAPGGQGVGFSVVDSRLLDENGRPATVVGTVWNWVKRDVHPRLGHMVIDLGGALAELRGVLPLVLHAQTAARLQQVLASVRIVATSASADGVTLVLHVSAPMLPASHTPEAPLSAHEMQRFEAALSDLDAFLTFVVKQSAGDTALEDVRDRLLELLLDTRYRIAEVLSRPVVPGTDPVRALFMQAWTQLAPVVSKLGTNLPGEEGLRYLSFVAAGDALRAIDRLGPGTGLDISADGLRRLARIVAPHFAGDPLQYGDQVDPELRKRFGFGPPLPPPAGGPVGPSSLLDPMRWLLPDALAAEPGGATDPALDARLDGWVPTRADLERYLPLVRELLDHTVQAQLATGNVGHKYHHLFRTLVLSTAWQESCWRQFVLAGGKVQPLRSPAGSLGMMQVNRHVWRGFYDVQDLAHDIGYNARAGAEILAHYLVDYALRDGEQKHRGGLDNLARATYASYNGGPGQLTRYRSPRTPRPLRAIDQAFYKKYRTIAAGHDLAVAACYKGN